ncbi:2',3'-cyclic-nucleotide 2'-phosphodiesterase, partial [Erwinia amylovora]
GGQFAGTGEKQIAFASPAENRSILAGYIGAQTRAQGEVNAQADNNWRLAPINSSIPLDIRFATAPGEQAAEFIRNHARYPLAYKGTDRLGFALYQLQL